MSPRGVAILVCLLLSLHFATSSSSSSSSSAANKFDQHAEKKQEKQQQPGVISRMFRSLAKSYVDYWNLLRRFAATASNAVANNRRRHANSGVNPIPGSSGQVNTDAATRSHSPYYGAYYSDPWIRKVATGRSVCYNFYGCYSTSYPWTDPPRRNIERLPRSPTTVQPKYYLYRTGATQFLPKDMKDALLRPAPGPAYTNVIVVAWNTALITRAQARADARLAGDMIARFFQHVMILVPGFTAANMHVIGHGLGAHLGSYIGTTLKGSDPFAVPVLARLTALDPDHFGFSNTDIVVRVDPTDALFVDVIHTDVFNGIEGVGTAQAMGHYDFYPNGGSSPQPGCDNSFNDAVVHEGDYVSGYKYYSLCSHFRAPQFFTESLTYASAPDSANCEFRAVSCSSWTDFVTAKCAINCPAGTTALTASNCARMGFYSAVDAGPTPPIRSFFLRTGNAEPFCKFQYYVTLKFGSLTLRNTMQALRQVVQRNRLNALLTNQISKRSILENNNTIDVSADGSNQRQGRASMTNVLRGNLYLVLEDGLGNYIEGVTFRLNSKPAYLGTNSDIGAVISYSTIRGTDALTNFKFHLVFSESYGSFGEELAITQMTFDDVDSDLTTN
ncbi:unnamed protein product, partial [Notodromas monacha]